MFGPLSVKQFDTWTPRSSAIQAPALQIRYFTSSGAVQRQVALRQNGSTRAENAIIRHDLADVRRTRKGPKASGPWRGLAADRARSVAPETLPRPPTVTPARAAMCSPRPNCGSNGHYRGRSGECPGRLFAFAGRPGDAHPGTRCCLAQRMPASNRPASAGVTSIALRASVR